MAEVGHAVTRQGLILKEANDLVNQLYSHYEYVFQRPEGNPGVCFDSAYDLKTLKPLPAWQRIYEEVKDEVHSFGLELY